MNFYRIRRMLIALLGAAALTAPGLYSPPVVSAAPSYIIYNDDGQPAEDGKQSPRSYTGIWARSSYSPSELIHNDRFADYDKIECIDVSYHQSVIDWNAVASSGIRYAYIRIGFRGYGSGNIAADPRFVENFIGAKEAGIKVGVYFYTQAITTEEAAAEARYVLDTLTGFPQYTVDLPIYYDVEPTDAHGEVGRVEAAALTSEDFTSNCHAFCQTIRSGGYQAGVYTCRDWLEHHLNAWELETQYDIWLAHYTYQTSYAGKYNIWQYSSSGKIDGIRYPVDRNIMYIPRGSHSAPTPVPLLPPSLNEITGLEIPGLILRPPNLNEITGLEMPSSPLKPPSLSEITEAETPEMPLIPPSLNEITEAETPETPLIPPSLNEITGLKTPETPLTPPSLGEITGLETPESPLTPPSLGEITGMEPSGTLLTPPSLSEITGMEILLPAPLPHQAKFQDIP